MFLTRLGFGSRAVITGDISQVDLPRGHKSGLAQALTILADIEEIHVHRFMAKDVVRHHLVQKIVGAYDNFDEQETQRQAARKAAIAEAKQSTPTTTASNPKADNTSTSAPPMPLVSLPNQAEPNEEQDS